MPLDVYVPGVDIYLCAYSNLEKLRGKPVISINKGGFKNGRNI